MAQYDPAKRRRGIRRGRDRGVWIYVPAVELQGAGFDPKDDPPFYRLWHRKRAILVQLYREP
jgi:hypothetical protein